VTATPIDAAIDARLDGPQAWFRLAVAMAIGAVGTVGMWAVVLFLPVIQDEFGIDRAASSMPYTLLMAGFAFGNVIVGQLVDRYGIFRPIVGATCLLALGYVSAALSPNIWLYGLSQGLLIGIGMSVSFGPLMVFISMWFQRRRGVAMAMVASGNYLAGVIWPVPMNLMIDAFGWRVSLMVIAALCLALMLPLSLLLRGDVPDGDAQPSAPSPYAARKGRLDLSPATVQVLLVLAGLGCCVAMSMPQVHMVAYCSDLGYGRATGSEMLSILLFCGVVSRIGFGYLADYIGGIRTLFISSFLQCLALTLYLPFTGLTALYLVSIVFGLSQGGIVPSYAVIIREYLPAREAGRRVGLVVMATVVGMAFGGWLNGVIFDLTGSYRLAFLNGIAWNVFNLGIVMLLIFRRRPAEPRRAIA